MAHKKIIDSVKKQGQVAIKDLDEFLRFIINESDMRTYDYRAAHGVSKDHWLDAYCIACSVLPNDVCDSDINNRVPYV